MQITIDTKHDSPQEIRKAIRMLTSLVGNSEVYTNEMPAYEPEQKTPSAFENNDMSGMMSIFDNNTEKEETQEDVQTMEFY